MRLYNVYGELVKTIQTDSGTMPMDVAVTKNGDLIYTDPGNSTVNIVTNTQRNVIYIDCIHFSVLSNVAAGYCLIKNI